MEAPKRKITAKVNRDAAPSPIPTRPPSQASNARASRLDISSPSPSPPAVIRPKAKVSSSATVGSLKVAAAKSPGPAISNGRKTPVSSVAGRATRERPASLVGPPTRRPMAPLSQPASPMLPPSQRAKSPQPRSTPRVTSPAPRSARRVKSPDPRPERRLMSPSPPNRRVLTPSPTIARRVASPVAPPGRRLGSPIRAPALTIPKRGASPIRSSPLNSQSFRSPSHRRVASASSALSGSSTGPPELPRARPRLPQSLSAITLDLPAPFSAIPKSPPKSAQANLETPPPLRLTEPDTQPHHYDSSTESSKSSTPPSTTLPALLSAQITTHVTSSAPVTPTHIQTPSSDAPGARPRTSSVSVGPTTSEMTTQPQTNGTITNNMPPGVRIKAKITPTTSASNLAPIRPPIQARLPQLAAPESDRSGSVSGGSTISGIAPSMISGVSSIRVSANSRILSPPPDRRIPFLGLNLSGSTFPVPPALQSPPSTISSMSSASQASRHSRSASYIFGPLEDRARTPTDLGLRPRISGGPSTLGISRAAPEDDGADRDDSGIDMFEADDGEQDQREEARSNRKIADLEISNKSLLAINATLEATKARQAKEIRDLRRKLRESRLVLPHHTFVALEQTDPLKDIAPESASAEDEDDSDDNDVTQTQADETFARVRLLLDGLITDAKTALETGPTCISMKAGVGGPPIRVLNVHDEDEYTTGKSEDGDEIDETDETDETDESQATESIAGDLESIDGVSPLSETPPTPIPVPAPTKGAGGGTFSGLRSSLGRWM
ncbi:hypothetical protein FRC10_000487 [Ceratobasidium sp. 414]|nr:hypothetical protein FRC10_000487 [Ceratobasidium sp. 414]